MRVVRALSLLAAPVIAAACAASKEPSPFAPGTYVLHHEEETVMLVDENGDFTWMTRSCSDWIRSGGGSFEREPDGSIRIIACADPHPAPGAFWAPNI